VDIYTRVSAVAVALTLALTLTPNPNPNRNRNRNPNPNSNPNQVSAVPVARSSVRGQIPSGERCDNASRAANSTGSLTVELGLEARVPF